jgi:hypothetical protein
MAGLKPSTVYLANAGRRHDQIFMPTHEGVIQSIHVFRLQNHWRRRARNASMETLCYKNGFTPVNPPVRFRTIDQTEFRRRHLPARQYTGARAGLRVFVTSWLNNTGPDRSRTAARTAAPVPDGTDAVGCHDSHHEVTKTRSPPVKPGLAGPAAAAFSSIVVLARGPVDCVAKRHLE